MLSHHELAKLVLINSAPDQIAISDPDVGALVELKLVDRFSRGGHEGVFRITERGISVLRKLNRSGGATRPTPGGASR